jgi:glycerol uptake facilitator
MSHLLLATSIFKLGPDATGTSRFFAEMVGTAILILFGDGVVAAVLLAKSKAENAGWIVITAGWAFAVAIAVYATAAYSGAFINPAVAIAWAVTDQPGPPNWGQLWYYIAGELLGAMIGATLVYLAYYGHWKETEDPGLKLAVFSTGPAIRNTVQNLTTEIIGTIALVFGVLAIINHFASGTLAGAVVGNGFVPLIIGFLVWVIGLSLGGPTGYAINPARDLGPRIMHAVLPIPGKGTSDWNYAWIPVVGPIIGGIIGAALFNLFYPG